MDIKKRFILSSLGALSVFNFGTDIMAMAKNENFQGSVPQNLNFGTMQPSNFVTPKVNSNMNQKILANSTTTAAKKTSGNIVSNVIYGAGGTLLGFTGGSLFQYARNQNEINGLNDQITNLNRQLQDERSCRQYDCNKLTAEKDDFEKQVKDLKDENKVLNQENGSLKSKIQVLEDDDKNKTIFDLQEKLRNLENEFEEFKIKNKKNEKHKTIAQGMYSFLYSLASHCHLILKDLNSDFESKQNVQFSSVAELATLDYFLENATKMLNNLTNNGHGTYIHYSRDRDRILDNNYGGMGFKTFVNENTFKLNMI